MTMMDPPLVLAIQTSKQGINLLLFCCCCIREGGGDDTDQDEESWIFDDCSLWDESWLITLPEHQAVSSEEEKRDNIPVNPHWNTCNQERPMNCNHLTTERDCHHASLSLLLSFLSFKSDRGYAEICIPTEEEFILCPWKH
jgi:hypothetical protein